MESSASGLTKKNNDFSQFPESFRHAVRVLMHVYAIVSMADPIGQEWCSVAAAPQHVSTVASLSRANSEVAGSLRHRIMKAEAAVTPEREKLGRSQPGISLTSIIDVVSQRHAICPLLSEFARNQTRAQKGGQEPTHKGWNESRRPYNRRSEKGKGAQ